MRRRMILIMLNVMLLVALGGAAGASGGICIPSNDPYHKPPLCLT